MNDYRIMQLELAREIPCPFCGSDFLDICHHGMERDYRFVACQRCAATGPWVKVIEENEVDAIVKAVHAWRKRNSK